MNKYQSFFKKHWSTLALGAVALLLSLAALYELGGGREALEAAKTLAASGEVTNWGLSFQQEGQPPIANADAAYLAQFDSAWKQRKRCCT